MTTPDEEMVEKTAKIKLWVRNRLMELEHQNERLREQNLRCTNQLQLLKSFTERRKQLKEEMAMSKSITGALPLLRDMENRTSDDSGLTSDETSERKNLEMMTKSSNADMMKTSVHSTPRQNRKPVRLRGNSNNREEEKESSTSDSSPFEEKPKPIPVMRLKKAVERDSFNSFADEYEFDCEEMFDEIVESPTTRSRDYAQYVNLADFCIVRDDKNIYSDIVKSPVGEPPRPPEHKPRAWESSLYEVADKCLSIGCDPVEGSSGTASPYHIGRLSNDTFDGTVCRRSTYSKQSHRSSPRVPSTPGGDPRSEVEYSSPPEVIPVSDIRMSLIHSTDGVEKCGYWSQSTDNRLKSLKRRYVVLKDGQLLFHRSHKKMSREEEPVSVVHVGDIRSCSVVKSSPYSFQMTTSTGTFTYMTDSEKTTADWVQAITQSSRGVTLREMATRSVPVDSTLCGYLIRVRCGHSKRTFASLVGHKLMFFKTSDDTVPSTYLSVSGARVCEKATTSSDEYSGSSDDQLEDKPPGGKKKETYSLCIELPGEDPLYLILDSAEEKEKWLYFLRAASGDATLKGTPFEVLVQRMMVDGAPCDSPLWSDLLFSSCEESPNDTLTTIENKEHRKKALEITKACHLFVSVLMRPIAVQYHIDLAQNILSTAVHLQFVRNEVYAQLIRLTMGSMPFGLQGWKLLALTIPLFTPKQYALHWLLKRHLARWASMEGDEAAMAVYCENALDRSTRMGGRLEGPSRLEVNSFLTRDPTTTKFPHSISVRLPNNEYQVVELDGSTEVGQCLSSLCLKLGMRPALLSGYALYIDHPATQQLQLLKGKQKVCDCLTVWEQHQKDVKTGKISQESAALLVLRHRHYWRHLVPSETPIERSFLVWRMAEEMRAGRVPMSAQLADHILALYAQLSYGDFEGELSEGQFSFLTERFYPSKMMDVISVRTLKATLCSNWNELQGMSEQECIRVILQVLRKWPLFGAHLHEGCMRMSNEKKIYLALHDHCLHIIDHRHMEVIRTFPYHRLVSFGDFHGDFMLTVDRVLPPDCHPEETSRERLTFSMEKTGIEQLTLHLAEYIRCQKLVWKVSK